MKKIMMIVALCASLAIGWSTAQQRRGVPAYRGPIERIQPDGDTLIIRLHGDEHKHWTTTEDGYLIKEDRSGRLCYALQKKNGTIVAGRRQAHNAAKRSACEQKYLIRKGVLEAEYNK